MQVTKSRFFLAARSVQLDNGVTSPCIVSKEDIAYHITIDDIPHYTCLDFTKLTFQSLGKKGKWVHCEHRYVGFRFISKVDYDSDGYIHTPTCAYNKVMWVLELAGVVKFE